jgi:hypothetical protein
MKRYEPTCPRVTFGFAAAIMTAFTIGVLVVLPSKMEPDSQAFALLEASGSASTNPCAAPRLKCVDVAAVRESASAPVQVSEADPKCKQQS